ncbi:MAG: hypothetical protein IJD48_03805 [Clostridia bacterium]|nr:hypothetical protein [Clostridia bacterium]
MIKVDEIVLPILYKDDDILNSISSRLKISKKDIQSFEIVKISIDARRKPNIKYICSFAVCLKNNLEDKYLSLKYNNVKRLIEYKKIKSNKNFVIVGFGPSGMFLALALAKMGLKPIIVEQGKQVDERTKDVENLWKNRIVDKYSNVQFGEGGAGTFSDGKLNTNLNNDFCKVVLNEFVNHGAPEQILYQAKPHIGSDKLKQVVKNIRQEIIILGGKFMFSTKLVDIVEDCGQIKQVVLQDVYTKKQTLQKADHLFLCVGHSARDTFECLHKHNVLIKQKPFAMGVRIEQKQSEINLSQYGKEKIDGLPNADYKLVCHLPNGRSVFTFCMCPGGQVVLSSSDDGEVVTNGMSLFARDKENANSAVLVNVVPDDYNSTHPLAGIYFQKRYEQKAFELGGNNFDAPCQTVKGFLNDTQDNCKLSKVNPSYLPGVKYCNIKECLPDFIVKSLKQAFPLLNKKLKNFAADENLLIAIESRSSCPLTILRDENYESSIKGLYPVGEGAGYAGGIMSSAQDGLKVAEAIYNKI